MQARSECHGLDVMYRHFVLVMVLMICFPTKDETNFQGWIHNYLQSALEESEPMSSK